MEYSTFPAPSPTTATSRAATSIASSSCRPKRRIPSASGPARAGLVRIHRPTRGTTESFQLSQGRTHPEPPNRPRRGDGQSLAWQAQVTAPQRISPQGICETAPPSSAVRPGARPEVLERFRDGLSSIEGTLAEIDTCAATPVQKIEGYAAQFKLLKQWMTVQHAQWPALYADPAANQALRQTLARLEAGTGALSALQPPPLVQHDAGSELSLPSGASCGASSNRYASAEAAWQVGFKAAAFLTEQIKRAGGVSALNELVDVLCVAADAFTVCTAGQPPCGNDLRRLQELSDALAGLRLNAA